MRVWDDRQKTVRTIAGLDGVADTPDGVGVAARFLAPYGLAVDDTGSTLYIADSGNPLVIRRIALATNTVDTVAGDYTDTSASSVDGPRGTSRIKNGNIAWHAGKLYVTDATKIRVLDPSTLELTISGAAELGTRDGDATTARWAGAFWLVGQGNLLWVYDSTTLRSLDLGTREVKTVVGSFDRAGMLPGALPGSLHVVASVTALDSGDLVVTGWEPNVMRVRLP